MGHTNTTDRPTESLCVHTLAPSTASMLACQHAISGGACMLGCTPTPQTDQHPCHLLAGWPSTSMPACQHASMPQLGVLACRGAPQQHRQTSMPESGCWYATVHASMHPARWPWVLACTPACSTRHPAILRCTLGCWPCGHAGIIDGVFRCDCYL